MIALFFSFVLIATVTANQTPPKYGSRYFVQGVLRVPYAKVNTPITAWTDETQGKQIVESDNGLATMLYRYDKDATYEIVPEINQYGCFISNVSGPAIALAAAGGPSVLPLVPDITHWTYTGVATINNIDADVFQFSVFNSTTYGSFNNVYRMYVHPTTRQPMRLWMFGINLIINSHVDEYVFDYSQYNENPFADSVFDAPALCANNLADTPLKQRRSQYRARGKIADLARVMPPMLQHHLTSCSHKVHPEFVDFTVQHGKSYHSCVEHESRQNKFFENVKFVQQWNADPSNTHTVAVNRYADLDDEEYRAVVLQPRDGSGRAAALKRATSPYVIPPAHQDVSLLSSVNWVQNGVAGPVKDQMWCGSCWAFGSSVAASGAYAVKHGKFISVSEQQLMDCSSWGKNGNSACDGGFAPGAYDYLIKAGGQALESQVPYKGQDSWCVQNDHSSGVQVTSYQNITTLHGLLSAVQNGPVAIAVDASLPSFRFYSHGVYRDPLCKQDINSLDHEVALVGYDAVTRTATIQNSWSTYSNNGGYLTFDASVNTCGMATAATQPQVL